MSKEIIDDSGIKQEKVDATRIKTVVTYTTTKENLLRAKVAIEEKREAELVKVAEKYSSQLESIDKQLALFETGKT